ncbi:MAG: adenylate kinase [Spirochaetales bacterium]|nr:adenylate kinase [Spirochaetales bacterium]MCF7937113.1 adenylate kinase [Spirochaetales bacterium]
MNLIFLGPPGAGKGTLASMFSESNEIPHISTGDLFREAVQNKTELGNQVELIMAEGGLVPDTLTTEMVRERLQRSDCKNGYILDGFPRTIAQAEALIRISTVEAAVYFAVPDEDVIRRLSGRRVCARCKAVYHIRSLPPKQDGICDKCGEPLIIRDDDKPEAIKKRLDLYRQETAPLIEFYKKQNLLKEIDGTGSPESVYVRLNHVLDLET